MQHKINIAASFLFLNMAIRVLELDRHYIEQGRFKIKTPYIEWVNSLISKAINERRELKSVMHRDKIQVNFLYREGKFTYYEFIINRSKTVKCYFNPIIKKNVEHIIDNLMKHGSIV